MAGAQALAAAAGDLRAAARGLRRSPAFTATAVLALAVGLTGTTVMLALIDGVLLRPLPLRAEHEVLVGWRGPVGPGARHWPFTTADLDLLRRNATQLTAVAGVGYTDPWPMLLGDAEEPWVVRTARVTGDFFEVLGAEARVGRTLRASDDRAGAENTLVLSHGLWQRNFGADPAVVGRRVTLGGQRFSIVGVMPQDVDHPKGTEVWTTVAAMQTTTVSPDAQATFANELLLVARLRTGTSPAAAAEELRRLAPALDALRPATPDRGPLFLPQVQSFREAVVGDVRTPLVVLLGAVAFVLLLACANVTSLMAVRAEARRGEFAVRAALGASAGRLFRLGLAEGALLSGGAGLLAIAAASALLPALLVWVPDGLPRAEGLGVGARVMAMTAVVAAITAVLVAWLPATGSARALMEHLRASGRAGGAPARARVQRVLVVGQVALAVVGLVGVGLLAGSLRHLRREAAALDSDELVLAPLVMPQAKYTDRTRWRRLVSTLVDTVAADPRIRAATPVNATPFTGKGWETPVITAEGQTEDDVRTNPSLNLEEVDPSYFATFAVPVLRGRAFTAQDREGAPRVAIVTADVAARVWPGHDPIGKRLKWGAPTSDAEWLTVVGIAGSTGYRDLRAPWPSLYVPAAQMLGAADQIVVRTSMPLAQLVDLLRTHLRALDPDVTLMPPRPFERLLEEPLAGPRFYALMMTIFGVSGAGLAGLGLYGVVAHSVRQRRREIGIRLALGAHGRDIRRLVVREWLALTVAGVGAGIVAARLLTWTMRSFLFGIDPLDPGTVTAAIAAIAAVAAAALASPLRVARGVAPAEVLRTE